MTDQFVPAYRTVVVACKSDKRWFDLDAVRTEYKNADDATRSRFGGKKLDNADVNFTTEGSYDRSYAGAPPLDYWLSDTQAGVDRVLKSMLPERVCKVCGEPSRRITRTETEQTEAWLMQPLLAAHIKERREALGVTSAEINGWFGYKEIAKNWERTDKFGAAVPNPKDWPELKSRLSLSDEFDAFVLGERRWSESESTVDYVAVGDGTTLVGVRRDGSSYGRGGHDSPGQLHANRVAPDEWSDCGHDSWRAGVVLDPFDFPGPLDRLPADSVDLVFSCSPVPETVNADHLDRMLELIERCDRILAPHGSLVLTSSTLLGWCLAYGRNLLRPERRTPRWRIRNVIVWPRTIDPYHPRSVVNTVDRPTSTVKDSPDG